MRHILPPRLLYEFAEILATTGKRCFLVGGAVRDYILGRPVSDYDLTTDAHPEEVMNLFSHVILTGVKHGTVTVLWKGLRLETTTFRTEKGYSDGRRPDEVRFASTIDEDLGRRDFTINAMAYDLVTRELVDPYEGQSDLSRQIIRAVGDPKLRFFEDGLRPLRAIRFATQLGFDIDPATFGAIPGALERFKLISVERIRDELQKIILSPWPSRGLKLMEECGMLAVVIPELASSRGTEQKGMHRFDVLDHLFVSLDAAPADLIIRLAALFHDVGKPAAKVETPGAEPTFHRHEEISFRMAAAILRRLRFPNSLIEEVCHLVRQHMFSYDESWSDAAVRRFVSKVGLGEIERLFALRLADGTAMTGNPADPRSLEPFRERIEAVLAADHAFGLRDLAVGGEDLASAGIPRGPNMGKILAELLETVLDDPGLNTKERLIEIARRLKSKYGIA